MTSTEGMPEKKGSLSVSRGECSEEGDAEGDECVVDLPSTYTYMTDAMLVS